MEFLVEQWLGKSIHLDQEVEHVGKASEDGITLLFRERAV
jgi:hypothetical protein